MQRPLASNSRRKSRAPWRRADLRPHIAGQRHGGIEDRRSRDVPKIEESRDAKQRIAAIAAAIAPDLASLREMNDVLLVIAGPRNILLVRRQRRTNGVHTRHPALFILIDLGKDRSPDASHDAHVHDCMWPSQ